MAPQNTSAAEVVGWLKALGIGSLCQWDVLVFLYRHQTSLSGANHLSHLLDYGVEPVVAALDVLKSLGLVECSRVSQGARLYQFTVPPVSPRGGALQRLLDLAGHRAGRLLLTAQLRRNGRPTREDLQVIPCFLDEAARAIPGEPWRSQEPEGKSATWRKVI